MAIRNIRVIGDQVLEKKCKEIKAVDDKIRELANGMLDTMYEANGVGLAAPQVGILKRLVVIGCSPEGDEPIILINPVIIERSGEQVGDEGCLSVPGKSGVVSRPNVVKVRAFNLDMEEYEVEGEGLLARAFCHEIDHLDGVLYVTKVDGDLKTVQPEEE